MSTPDRRVVSLTIGSADGEQETVELPGPGGTVRFGVGGPGCRSGVWRVWSEAKSNKSDVYVAIRNIAGYQKWSLHESGDWRFQWVSEARAVEFGGTANRIIDRWEQPAEVGASGMTKGLSIWVRHCDVVSMDNDDDPKHAQVQWLPTPPPGSAVGIHIVVARPDQGIVDLSNSVPFDGFTLADGRVVLILMQYRELTDEVNAVVRDAQREAVARANVDWGAAVAPRMVISGFDDQGIRLVWDTAVIVNRESLS